MSSYINGEKGLSYIKCSNTGLGAFLDINGHQSLTLDPQNQRWL